MDWIIDLNFFPYKKTWELQKKLHSLRVNNKIPDVLLLVEHPHVFTLGKFGDKNNLLVSQSILEEKKIEVFKTERGGDITYHGPGQLVGYPIFHIQGAFGGIRHFVFQIEAALISALKDFNIEAYSHPQYRGVWVNDEKIAAIGIAVKKWVSFHGFAFNVNTNLSYFDLIIPCGIRNKKITSLKKIQGKKVNMEDVKKSVIKGFSKVFGKTFKKYQESKIWEII